MAEPHDVIEVLIADHRAMRQLINELDETDQPEQMRALYLRLVNEISAHEAAEQEVVFPAFRAAFPDDEQVADDRLGEHQEVDSLLAAMRRLSPSDLGFTKRVGALILDLRAHFHAEEESLFPRLRDGVAHAELVALAAKVEAVKKRAAAFSE